MALRNIFRQKRRTILTVLMMIFGYVLLSFSIAIVEGNYGNMIDAFTSQSTGHLQIHHKKFLENQNVFYSIENYSKMMIQLESDQRVKSVAPRVIGSALAFGNSKTTGVNIVGVDWMKEEKLTSLQRRIAESFDTVHPLQSNEVYVGHKIAKILKIKIGDLFSMISNGADGSIANDNFRVKGIMKKSSFDDQSVYLDLKKSQEFFSLYHRVTHISIILYDISIASEFVNEFKNSLKSTPFIIRSWKKIESDFYKAMKADKKGNVVTEFIIILMVSIGVLNTVLMAMLERTREFGLLKAIGTMPNELVLLVIFEVMIMACASIFLGFIFAYVINSYFSYYGIVYSQPMTYGGMTFSELKAVIIAKSFYRPAWVILFSSFIVALIPSYKVFKMKPIDGLRDF